MSTLDPNASHPLESKLEIRNCNQRKLGTRILDFSVRLKLRISDSHFPFSGTESRNVYENKPSYRKTKCST